MYVWLLWECVGLVGRLAEELLDDEIPTVGNLFSFLYQRMCVEIQCRRR
jgi:hypothetical protein